MFDPRRPDAFLLFAIAKEHEKLQDDAKALAYYEQLRATDEQYVGLYYHLGKLHERQGNDTDALAAYDKGIEVARAAGDRHAEGELAMARMELED